MGHAVGVKRCRDAARSSTDPNIRATQLQLLREGEVDQGAHVDPGNEK